MSVCRAAFEADVSPYLQSDDVPFVDYDAYDAQVWSTANYKTRPIVHG